jgi:hypothetical protein
MGPECRGKRSTSEVGKLAEEIGGGALGGVLSILGGKVGELPGAPVR